MLNKDSGNPHNDSQVLLEKIPLGKKSTYPESYAPELLFPISRKEKRSELGIGHELPFQGYDLWNAYELSWLNPRGLPQVAVGEIQVPCESPFLIESKSLKLYLNSLNSSRFHSMEEVKKVITSDLSRISQSSVKVILRALHSTSRELEDPPGIHLDTLLERSDIGFERFENPQPQLLKVQEGGREVTETLYSDLLKSNCLVTGQPDWGSVEVHYKGPKISPIGLLQYIVSFRNHQEFHEQCVERIFMDILNHCQPNSLTVTAYYTRRGGLDIYPFRTNNSSFRPSRRRLVRQ